MPVSDRKTLAARLAKLNPWTDPDWPEVVLEAAVALAAQEAGAEPVKRMSMALERERSKVAEVLEVVCKVIEGRSWLREPSRGSYAYDDERYQKEFGRALDEIEKAIHPLRKIAGDWTDCPTDPDEIKAARAQEAGAALEWSEMNNPKWLASNARAAIQRLPQTKLRDEGLRFLDLIVDAPAQEAGAEPEPGKFEWPKAVIEFEDFLNEPPQYEDKRMVRDYRHEAYPKWEAALSALRPLLASPPLDRGGEWEPTHRHKKRGSEYVLLGYGKMQAARWWSLDGQGKPHRPADMAEVAIYRSIDDGSLWARPGEEFEDGRFEILASSPSPEGK